MNKSNKVLVIGDIILDRFIYGNVSKISQEAPVPVFNEISSNYRLGGAANVAINLRTLNCETILIGLFGKSTESNKKTLSLIKENKISLIKIQDNEYVIPLKTRFNSNNQQVFRVDYEKNNFKNYSSLIIKKLKSIITKFEIVILSDYDKGLLNYSEKIIKFLKSKNKLVLVDPKSNNFKKYEGSYLIKPNRNEMERVVNCSSSNTNFFKKIKKQIEKNKLQHILLTLGDQGMILFNKKEKIEIKNILKPKIYDVTGAGDTVIATLAYFLNINYSLKEAVNLSNLAGNIVVSKNETASVNLDELLSKSPINTEKKTKIIDLTSLIKILKHQSDNKKIVFTNGCFDILHSGHIHLLKKAKELGDILIVGINSDKSISHLKGNGRPINKIKERLTILKSLVYVDYVIEFNEVTPIKLIKMIKPSFIVKGSDYKKNQVVGYDIVKKHGGDVKIIRKLKNLSSTIKLKKINTK